MEPCERGEEKQFVQVLFGKVEPAIRRLSSGPEMKNISGAEQFNQFKMNWGIDTIGHENDDEGWREDGGRVILGESQTQRAPLPDRT